MPKGPGKPVLPVVPRVRRGYFESRYGQLHVHNAIPPGGGFDESTSLICLHAPPRSAASLLPLLALMGMDRSVYAPDLPGFGNTVTPPHGQFTYRFDALADVIAGLVDALGLTRQILLGHHHGQLQLHQPDHDALGRFVEAAKSVHS